MQLEEAQNFRLLGHDPSAAFGCGSLVEVVNGHAFVGSVGGSNPEKTEGSTVHDVRDPRNPLKVLEFKAPPGVHMHKLRYAGNNILYVNSERLKNEAAKTSRSGFYIFDISSPASPHEIGFFDMPGSGPHRFGVDLASARACTPKCQRGSKRTEEYLRRRNVRSGQFVDRLSPWR